MSDWSVGDLALCVDDAPQRANQNVLVKSGQTYRVVGFATTKKTGLPALLLDGVVNTLPPNRGKLARYYTARFRKIRPDEHQACEEEFVTLLRRSKRKVAA